MFNFREKTTLCCNCYKEKRTRAVILDNARIWNRPRLRFRQQSLHRLLSFCYSKKGEVDIVDEYKAKYLVARICNCWLLQFFGLINIDGLLHEILMVYKIKSWISMLSDEITSRFITMPPLFDITPWTAWTNNTGKKTFTQCWTSEKENNEPLG